MTIEDILALSFFFVQFYCLWKSVKVFQKTGSVNVFDGLFLGGIFFIIVPLVVVFFAGRLTISDFDSRYSFDISDDFGLFVFCNVNILIMYLFSMRSRRKKMVPGLPSEFSMKIFVLTFFLYIISEIIFFISSGKMEGGGHWYSSNENTFNKGPFYVLIGQVHNVGRVILPAVLMYFRLKYNTKRLYKFHFGFSIFLIVFELLLTGNRIVMLFVLFSFFIPYIITKNYKRLVRIMLYGIPLVLIGQFWSIFRGLIWQESFSVDRFIEVVDISYNQKRTNELNNNPIIVITEGSNLVFLNYVFKRFPKNEDFLLGETLILKSVGTFIPKSIWKDKPEALGLRVGAAVAPQFTGLALNTTIIGEGWANFGYLGIIFIMGFVRIIDGFFRKTKNYEFYSLCLFFVAIAAWRFDFAFFIIAILIIILMNLLLKIKAINIISARISNKLIQK